MPHSLMFCELALLVDGLLSFVEALDDVLLLPDLEHGKKSEIMKKKRGEEMRLESTVAYYDCCLFIISVIFMVYIIKSIL